MFPKPMSKRTDYKTRKVIATKLYIKSTTIIPNKKSIHLHPLAYNTTSFFSVKQDLTP